MVASPGFPGKTEFGLSDYFGLLFVKNSMPIEQSWQLNDGHDASQVSHFANQLNSPPVLAELLLNRGVYEVETARRYFIPKLEHLHDPYLMADMGVAVDRIEYALKHRQKILIYGDYDVDGTTATAMMIRFFRITKLDVDFYIPDRLVEGYGLSEQGITRAYEKGIDLIITVDCGVTAADEITRANELGIDVIVCDHHQHGPDLPPACAVLNPKRIDCNYPFKELAGVGVAFKLLQALQQRLELAEERLFELLYFVAMGSAADIVPLVDENRVFVRHGLRDMSNNSKNVGLHALMEVTNLLGREIGTGQIVFVLAPRINAVGRLGDAGRAVKLLTTEDEELARQTASVLESENRQRREIDEATLKEAISMIEENCDPGNESVFVLDSESWHPGVVGIVASRIVERYFRPTVMIATERGEGRGSARSIPGFDIYQALEKCDDLMTSFGGHKYAAGLSLTVDKIPELRQRLAKVARDRLTADMLIPKLLIDAEVRFRDIEPEFLKLVQKMAPFGPQNTRPTFISRGLEIVGQPGIVGNNHLKFKVRQDGKVIDAIGFNLGDKLYRISPGEKNVEIAYVIDENHYQGRKTIQLRVKDLR